MRQRLGEIERLGEVERGLDSIHRAVRIAGEVGKATELRGEHGRVLVELLGREHLEGPVHVFERLLEPAPIPHDLGEPSRHPRRGVRLACALEEGDRLLKVSSGLVGAGADSRHQAGALVQVGLDQKVVGELERALERALRLHGRTERAGALRGAEEHPERRRADLFAIWVVRARTVGIEVVGRYDFDDLILLRTPGRRQEPGSGQMLRLALLLRDRLVRDVLDDVLQERVLAALGRAWVGLDREDLLADERDEQRLELVVPLPGERDEAGLRERLAEHRPVLDEPPLGLRQAVQPGCDQGVERLGHLERLHGPSRPVDVALLREQPSVEQHPARSRPHTAARLRRAPGCVRADHREVRGRARRAGPPWLLAGAAPGRARRSSACRRPTKDACRRARGGR